MIRVNLPQFLALLYADVFEYPLTKQELGKFQITNYKSQIKFKIQNSKCKTTIQNLKLKIDDYIREKDGYYHLEGRQKLINLRKKREKYSQEKMQIAKRVGQWLKIIPTIKMLAVTGAVAIRNAKANDDIDFLILVKSKTIWTTRFLTVVLLELLGKRRRPNEKNFKNKICLNMFLDENRLQVPKNEQDLFSAHEASQVKILWSRGDIERKWWGGNKWINKYLLKFKDSKSQRLKGSSKIKAQNNFFVLWILNLFCHLSFVICHLSELALKQLQIAYMKNRRTTEVITDGYLRFHPKDVRQFVLRKYQKRLRKYGLE